MFPSQYRLPLRELKDFFSRATKKRYPSFLLFTLPSSFSYARYAISVKSEGTSAVERNRLKRVVRATIFSLVTQIQSADYCFAIHSSQEKVVLKDLQQCLKQLLKTT
jgi:ribonuclease P protein component